MDGRTDRLAKLRVALVSELFHADGWTDRRTDRLTKLRVAFLNYANEPNNANLHTKGQEYLLHLSEVQNHFFINP